MRRRNPIAQLITLAMLSAVASAGVHGAPTQQGSGRPQQQPQMRTESTPRAESLQSSQARLAKEIRSELLTLPYYSVFDWLEFQIQPDGTVTLRGQVTTPPDTKSSAEAAVKDVEGVSKVINEIEVLPLSPNDQRLREALYRAIYSGPLFRYGVGAQQPIHIIVKNGRATLKGVVDNEGDKNLANVRANTVSGVFEVKNELIVNQRRNKM